MTNLRAGDMIGTSQHWKAFYPSRKPCLADVLIDSDAGGSGNVSDTPKGTCESTAFYPDPATGGKWLHCTATVIRDSQGNLTGAMETLQDVTAAKQRGF